MTGIKTFTFKNPKYQATAFSRDDEGRVFFVAVVAATIVVKLVWLKHVTTHIRTHTHTYTHTPNSLLNTAFQTLTEPETGEHSL